MAHTNDYRAQIPAWKAWLEKLKPQGERSEDAEGDPLYSVYLGSMLALCPSGRYYATGAPPPPSEEEARLAQGDHLYREALARAAEEAGGWVEQGDLDVFFCFRKAEEGAPETGGPGPG